MEAAHTGQGMDENKKEPWVTKGRDGMDACMTKGPTWWPDSTGTSCLGFLGAAFVRLFTLCF